MGDAYGYHELTRGQVSGGLYWELLRLSFVKHHHCYHLPPALIHININPCSGLAKLPVILNLSILVRNQVKKPDCKGWHCQFDNYLEQCGLVQNLQNLPRWWCVIQAWPSIQWPPNLSLREASLEGEVREASLGGEAGKFLKNPSSSIFEAGFP